MARPLAEQTAWADSIGSGAGRSRLPAVWTAAFERLGAEASQQRPQMKRACGEYFLPACAGARRPGPCSGLGIAPAFDAHLQNGSFRPQAFALAASPPADRPEIGRRRRLAHAVAGSAPPRRVEEVHAHKLALAEGGGVEHGRRHDLAGWGQGAGRGRSRLNAFAR